MFSLTTSSPAGSETDRRGYSKFGAAVAAARRRCGMPGVRAVRVFDTKGRDHGPRATVHCNTGELEFQLRGARRRKRRRR